MVCRQQTVMRTGPPFGFHNAQARLGEIRARPSEILSEGTDTLGRYSYHSTRGGTAGLVLAGRLTERNVTVAVLEAGIGAQWLSAVEARSPRSDSLTGRCFPRRGYGGCSVGQHQYASSGVL